jgi:small subunit ribosomal protein S1
MSNETATQVTTDAAKKKAEKLKQIYQELKNAFETGKTIDIEVLGKVKNGFKTSYKDFSLFLPLINYTSNRNITDEELSAIVGKTIPVKVKEYSDGEFGKIIQINHREIIEDKLWAEIQNNTETEAIVKAIIAKKGVVVNLPNGLEGFIPISYISFDHISDISSFIAVGDTIKGEIFEVDKSKKRIIISLLKKSDNPLNIFYDTYNVGDRIKGKLKSVVRSRAYFNIAPNVDGTLKMSEVSWTRRNVKFTDFFESNKEYEFEIINLDRDNRFIDLSYKRTQPDNWQEIAKKYEIGYTYRAVVEFIPPNGRGAEVSVNNEIDGFMPKQSSLALYNGNKPTFKAKDVIQVKLVGKNADTHSFIFEAALKQVNIYDEIGTSTPTNKQNISTPEVVKNFTLADLLSDSSKKALK